MFRARQKDTESHKRNGAANQPRPALGRRPWFALLRRARSLRLFALAIRRESVARSRRFITLASVDQTWVASDVFVASTFHDRWRGVKAGHPRVLLRTNSVHACGLDEPLRLVAVDAGGRVIAACRLECNGFARLPGATWVIEQTIDEPAPEVGSWLAIYARSCDWETVSVRHADRQLG